MMSSSTNEQTTNTAGNSGTAALEDNSTTSSPLGIEQIVDDDDGPICYEEVADSAKSHPIFIGEESPSEHTGSIGDTATSTRTIEEIPDDELPISPFQCEEQLVADDLHEKLQSKVKATRSVQWQEPPVEIEDRSTSSQQEESDPVVVDEESPPPPEEYRRTDRQDDSPPSPTYYEVEAYKVPDESTQPVYDAEPLEELPFWKKHAKYIIISITLLFAVLTTAITVGIMSKTSDNTANATPPYLSDSCVEYTGPLYETDCDGCSPPIGIAGNTTVCIWGGANGKGGDGEDTVDFFSHFDGAVERSDRFGINYKVGGVTGSGVAISGNFAVVGSPMENSFSGAIYVYEKDPSDVWARSQRLLLGDASASEGYQFGRYVDIDNDVMVVSSYDFQGSVYVLHYTNGTWVHQQKITPSNALNKDFGGVVKVKGKRIAIGDRMFGYDPEGAVFLYEYNEFSKSWEMISDGVLSNDDCDGRFGVNIALANDHELMVGCPKQNGWAGVVYHYSQQAYGSSYTLQQEIHASGGAAGNRLGQTQQIAADGNTMVIGEYKNVGGKTYVYTRKDANHYWEEVGIIDAPKPDSIYFGDQVALSGSNVVVASRDNSYAYDLKACRV